VEAPGFDAEKTPPRAEAIRVALTGWFSGRNSSKEREIMFFYVEL
jgi:hypothetical protein